MAETLYLALGKLETQWIGKMTTNQSVITLLFTQLKNDDLDWN